MSAISQTIYSYAIFVNEKFVLKGAIDNNPALV